MHKNETNKNLIFQLKTFEENSTLEEISSRREKEKKKTEKEVRQSILNFSRVKTVLNTQLFNPTAYKQHCKHLIFRLKNKQKN